MSEGTVVAGGERPSVRLERHLPDPPPVVWRALTEPEQLRSWFPCGVVVDGGRWVVGVKISFPFPSEVIDMTLTGEVLVVDEPRVLAFSWGDDVLRFELSPVDGGTTLVLYDELPRAWAARNAAGWDDCLDRLRGVTPGPDAWKAHFDVYSAAFEPDLGPQEGPPPEVMKP